MSTPPLHPALLWEPRADGKVQCRLCPWNCVIADGAEGRCQVRRNVGGKLFSLNYHKVCATHVDPIEKKPLFHFLPGSWSFSVACPGCNLRCDFCQNWQISQMVRESGRLSGEAIAPQALVRQAAETRCRSVSYTYTEPTVFYELCLESAELAHAQGLRNVFVSNGYISIPALEKISPYLDGINVDLKAFREAFYRQRCQAHLEPVKESLRWLARSRVWLEVTTLLIPGQNDDEAEIAELAEFIAGELGVGVPWHVSRYHPDYAYQQSPATPTATIERALAAGKAAGLRYCYGGNTPGHRSESTYCYSCGARLITRAGFTVHDVQIHEGRCVYCDTVIDGVWS